jgi:hypothetical protein
MFYVAPIARHNKAVVFFVQDTGYLWLAGVNSSLHYRVAIELVNLKYRDVAILIGTLFIFRELASFEELAGNKDEQFSIRLLLAYVHSNGKMLQWMCGQGVKRFLLPVLLHFYNFDFTDQCKDDNLQLVIVVH